MLAFYLKVDLSSLFLGTKGTCEGSEQANGGYWKFGWSLGGDQMEKEG